jgi:serine/threonine-protein kinase HipA
MKSRKAIVRIDGKRVGTLLESGKQVTFEYDTEWVANRDAVPVSVTLPVRADAYVSEGLHPYFENLLPEGWLLELATRKLKISKDDAFGLLLATCADCVGAVEMVSAEESAS